MKARLMIVVLLAAVLSAGAVPAQQWSNRDRLVEAVANTEDIISRAREAVSESGSERARNQLTMAERLQKMARDLMTGPIFNDDALASQVGKYTLSARQKAQQAIAITRQAEENEDFVRRRLERTDELIRQAQDEAGDDISPGLHALLGAAENQQERAVELFRNRRLKASLQLTLQTERSLQQAFEQQGGHLRTQRRYQARLERYLSLHDQNQLTGYDQRPEIDAELKNAERLREQAENLAGEGRYGRAEKIMTRAVNGLSRITETLREPAKIETALQRLSDEAERIRERVRDTGKPEIQDQYQTVWQHLEKATEMYREGDYESAAAQLQAARQVLHRIMRAFGE